MLVAGIDIGNTTTELVLAEVTPGSVTPLIARRAWTSGGKGSEDSVKGAARLVLSAERALGRRCACLLLAPLHPVLTLSASIPPPPSGPPLLRRLSDPLAGTPSGCGFAVGSHLPLEEIASHPGRSADQVVISVPAGVDFEEAAERIAAAQHMNLPVVGAIVSGDDAVLIANRIPRTIPIVDEADVGGLQAGELIAIEVAEPGGRVQVLSDPVALAAAFRLAPETAPLLTDLTLGLADARSAALALCHDAKLHSASGEVGWLEYDGERGVSRVPLSRQIAEYSNVIRPGSVRRFFVPRDTPLHEVLGDAEERVRDVFAVDLPLIRGRFFPRQGSVELGQVPFSVLLSPGLASVPSETILAAATGRPVHVVTSEAEAAALGALTTPGATEGAAVCDMGGGTIDLVWGDERITAAGAGELLTTSVARALGLQNKAAEYVKRFSSLRAEGPNTVHYEDGSRGFVDRSLPADVFGRLCYMRGHSVTAFSDLLAPEEWRSLRLAIKQSVIGASVSRCLKWLRGRPSTLLLCGGAALDAESVRIVTESVRSMGITVGRANINGEYGPRYGVALGLLLAYRRSVAGVEAAGRYHAPPTDR